MACGARRPQRAEDAHPSAVVAEPATEVPTATAPMTGCPRLPRVKRLWTGFADDVPSAAPLHLTLDAVVPIQEALGALFCAPEHAACRPVALQSIELTDAAASAARVQVVIDDAGGTRLLELRVLGGSWQAEPESLAAFLAACRARDGSDTGP